MRNQKVSYHLYRVSTKKQVDKENGKEDIPMQREACCAFAARQGWTVGKEFEEFGVSGYKVSANDRDKIQDLKDAALRGEFDILLVFMFDRLGRIDDETPFVVEWFVKHGIEVWSVKEGEQKFEQHVDKLTNYIRFWQASGESEKTSMRTKERLGQIVEKGWYRGGGVPYGYRVERQGRLNKRNHEVYEILTDEQEALVIRLIFDLYVMQGLGSHRIATYLTEHGYRNRSGENFTSATLYHILRNRSYLGVLKSGETESPIFPNLQIIDPDTFEAAQILSAERAKPKEERAVPLNTRGESLLSGIAYCGHCGARLMVTTNGKKRVRKDGTEIIKPRTRYVCYNKTRHKHKCDGQTGYTVSKLDKVIDGVIREMFATIGELPKESIVEEKFTAQIAEMELQLAGAKARHTANAAEVMEYEAEVLKVIRGESKLSSDLLNKLYEDAKAKATQSEELVAQLAEQIAGSENMKISLARQFDNIRTWAELYDECGIETKKMILSHIMKAVRVSRDYEVDIDMTVSLEEFWGAIQAIASGKTAENRENPTEIMQATEAVTHPKNHVA